MDSPSRCYFIQTANAGVSHFIKVYIQITVRLLYRVCGGLSGRGSNILPQPEAHSAIHYDNRQQSNQLVLSVKNFNFNKGPQRGGSSKTITTIC